MNALTTLLSKAVLCVHGIGLPIWVSAQITQTYELTSSASVGSDQFGFATALDGGLALVGSFRDDAAGSDAGSAFLYDVNTGASVAQFTANDAAVNDRFGVSVDLWGNSALIGSYRDDDQGADSGSAYLFDVMTGQQTGKLTALDGMSQDEFGRSVALEGNTALVGSHLSDDGAAQDVGSAYLFDATTNQQLVRLTALDGAGGDQFGRTVDLSGGVAIVGSHLTNDVGIDSGSAYLFDATSGAQLAKLTANDASSGDQFGVSVAIDGAIALVGSRFDDDGATDSGSAYLFDVASGTQLAKLTPDDPATNDEFGIAVALSGGIAAVGSRFDDDNGSNAGSVYLFDVATGQQLAKVTASNASAGDAFGRDVAIDALTLLVGSNLKDAAATNTGSAYLFVIPEPGTLALLGPGLLWLMRRPRVTR